MVFPTSWTRCIINSHILMNIHEALPWWYRDRPGHDAELFQDTVPSQAALRSAPVGALMGRCPRSSLGITS